MPPASHQAFRQQCYRWLFCEDPEDDGTLQYVQRTWRAARAAVDALFRQYPFLSEDSEKAISSSAAPRPAHETLAPAEEADLLHTLYVALEVCPRDARRFRQVARRAQSLLPLLDDPRQRLPLLVHLYADTLDPLLKDQIEQIVAAGSHIHTPDTHRETESLLRFYAPLRQGALTERAG